MAQPSGSTSGAAPSLDSWPHSIEGEVAASEIEAVMPSVQLLAADVTGEIHQSSDLKKLSGEMDPSDEKAKIDPSGGKFSEMENSRRERHELMDRLDPGGGILFMCLASPLYGVIVAWLVWRVADEPQALLWTFAHLSCAYLFLLIITLSETMNISTVFFRISYVVLLSFAAVHLIGPVNGMIVLYSGLLYVAGMFGYAMGEYFQRVGIERTAEALLLPPFSSKDYPTENGVKFARFFLAVLSLPILIRMAFVVFITDTVHKTLLDAPMVLVELPWEMWLLIVFGTLYVTEVGLKGALVTVEAFVWKSMIYFIICLGIGAFLFFNVAKAAGLLSIWLGLMGLGAFLGYTLAVSARYLKILPRSFHSACLPLTVSRNVSLNRQLATCYQSLNWQAHLEDLRVLFFYLRQATASSAFYQCAK